MMKEDEIVKLVISRTGVDRDFDWVTISYSIREAVRLAAKEIFTKFDEYSCIKNDGWYLDLKKEWIGGGNDGTKQL